MVGFHYLFEEMDTKPGVLFFYFQDIDLICNALSLVTYLKMLEIPVLFRREYDHQISIGAAARAWAALIDRQEVMPFRVRGQQNWNGQSSEARAYLIQ